ncbi:MAG: GFA family protein, partial [Alphaproteobacteria bacterium]
AYSVAKLSGPIVHCHCETCRKTHSAAFATTARVERADFAWTQGDDALRHYESSPGKVRHFCGQCGAHLMAERLAQAHVILRAASLDEDPDARPAFHIWTSHDVDWLDYRSPLEERSEI